MGRGLLGGSFLDLHHIFRDPLVLEHRRDRHIGDIGVPWCVPWSGLVDAIGEEGVGWGDDVGRCCELEVDRHCRRIQNGSRWNIMGR